MAGMVPEDKHGHQPDEDHAEPGNPPGRALAYSRDGSTEYGRIQTFLHERKSIPFFEKPGVQVWPGNQMFMTVASKEPMSIPMKTRQSFEMEKWHAGLVPPGAS